MLETIKTELLEIEYQGKHYSLGKPVNADAITRLPFYIRSLLIQSFDVQNVDQTAFLNLKPTTVILRGIDCLFAVEDLLAVQQALKKQSRDIAIPAPKIFILLNKGDSLDQCQHYYKLLKWASYNVENITIIPSYLKEINHFIAQYLSSPIAILGNYLLPELMMGNSKKLVGLQAIGNCYIVNKDISSFTDILFGKGHQIEIKKVLGVKLLNALPAGVFVQDFILNLLNQIDHRFKDHCLEFFGPGVDEFSMGDRILLTNGEFIPYNCFFPIDKKSINSWSYLDKIKLIEIACKHWMLYRSDYDEEPIYDEVLEIDLSTINLTTISLSSSKISKHYVLQDLSHTKESLAVKFMYISINDTILSKALITACLIAKKACDMGLTIQQNIRAFFLPSKEVQDYLFALDLLKYIAQLGFLLDRTICDNKNLYQDSLSNDQQIIVMESGKLLLPGFDNQQNVSHIFASPVHLILSSLLGRNILEPSDNNENFMFAESKDIWPSPQEVNHVLYNLELYNLDMRAKVFNDLNRGTKAWHKEPILRTKTYPLTIKLKEPEIIQKKTYVVLIKDAAWMANLTDFNMLSNQLPEADLIIWKQQIDTIDIGLILSYMPSFIIANSYNADARKILLKAGILTLRWHNRVNFAVLNSLQAKLDLACLKPFKRLKMMLSYRSNGDIKSQICFPILEAAQQDINCFLEGGGRRLNLAYLESCQAN